MPTSNLGIPELLESQSNKVVTVNEAFEALDNASNAVSIRTVGSGISLTQAQLASGVVQRLTAASANFNLRLPAFSRLFIVDNRSGFRANVFVDPAGNGPDGTAVEVENNNAMLLYSDGTNVIGISGGGGGGGTPGFSSLNTQTGASYVPVLADANNVLILMDRASGQSLLFPPDSEVAFPVGTVLNWMQIGVGLLSFNARPGAVLNSRGGALNSAGRWAQGTSTKIAANTWVLAGDVV